MVIRFREIVYTLILVFLVFFLIFCLVLMFGKGSADHTHTDSLANTSSGKENVENASDEPQTDSVKDQKVSSTNTPYTAGVYSSSVSLGDFSAEVQVTVSNSIIQSIDLVNLSEETAASYPLLSTSLEALSSQILEKQKLEGITCSATNRYTSQLLYNAISAALAKASDADRR
ncbi:MAG: hypothetical protein LIP12_07920 [Clostridiales bacterium]|nr:hypothetical protein [Clostridiales bacterium]